MLQLTPQQRLLFAVTPIDFRNRIKGIVALCQQQLQEVADTGTVFAFANRKKTAVKILVYDGQGFWLCMKRFSQGKLRWWPTGNGKTQAISAYELQIVLSQGHPKQANIAPDWKRISSLMLPPPDSL